jgi:hypothetical protein
MFHSRLLLLLDASEQIECLPEMPFIGERHCLGIEVLVGQRGGMAVDAGMLLAAPHAARAAADLGAALLLGAVFVAGRTCALGRLGRLSVPAFRIGERSAGEDAKTGEQDDGAESSPSHSVCTS